MAEQLAAMCGVYCGDCAYKEKMKCRGCRQMKGTMFWGRCKVATCCMKKRHENCSQCKQFPCELLKEYAVDPSVGDDGQRIRNLEAWRSEGFETWLANREPQDPA